MTDKQFEQLQTELIKDVIKRAEASKTSKKKFVDVVVECCNNVKENQAKTHKVSISIDSIVSLETVKNYGDFKSVIVLVTNSCGAPGYLCTSSIEEIKQMIKEAENND
ncbi:hypothetical protein [Gilliamella sp. ESL0232]|uniref:hypothetical protein n=1 Tax=Gilliamella sp. ESL0232 TaxID=2705037 RepID=UPI001EEAC53A|nr:hypothetical protein [Gilliamella sp. ESL0232]